MNRPLEIFDKGVLRQEVFSASSAEIQPEVGLILRSMCQQLAKSQPEYRLILRMTLLSILRLTASEFGNVAVRSDQSLLCLALEEREPGLVNGRFKSVEHIPETSFFGHSLANKTVVISNDVLNDTRMGHSPTVEGHPKVTTFMSVPLLVEDECVGQLALANRYDGYATTNVALLLPVLDILASVVQRYLSINHSSQIKRVNEADEARRKFLDTVSHALRTPLHGVVSIVTMLPDAGDLNGKQKEYMRLLTECTFQLSNTLNNVLDFSKMTSNSLTLQRKPFEVRNAVRDAVSIVEGRAVAKNLEIRLNVERDIPSMVGDSQRLTQILANLLSNSVKFTSKGHVHLTVRKEMEEADSYATRWRVIFTVKDTGIGIPRDEQDKIFETFYQATSLSPYLSQSGTGLGLSIVKELVRLMGGKVSVYSEGVEGQGSTFTFYVLLDEEIKISASPHLTVLQGARVIVIDDRPEIRMHLYQLLRSWKCEPVTFASAEEALQDLRSDSDLRYKVAIIDVHMPYMSGIELAQTMRREFPNLPLIGISSVDVKGGADYFDHYMFKPIDQNTLFPALLHCLSHATDRRQSSKALPFQRVQKTRSELRILVAEDDPNNAFVMKEMLLSLGYSSITAVEDGQKCLEALRSASYDVVLMDLIMPVMDGFEATKHIRQMDRPPLVIAISAAVQNEDKDRCQKVGIDCYLPKPLLREHLDSALSPLVKRT